MVIARSEHQTAPVLLHETSKYFNIEDHLCPNVLSDDYIFSKHTTLCNGKVGKDVVLMETPIS